MSAKGKRQEQRQAQRQEPASPQEQDEAAPRPAAAFPGGNAAPAAGELRIAVDRIPYSQIIGHAILEPDVEVGGVLVGGVGEDEHGTFVHVRHAIRAEGAHQENAAVTFTHETWNHIHQEMDAKYPDEQIVGWYHTHGGFGVFLSEMDTFIHQNFFSEPHHVAYVYDPLAGSEGFFVRKGEALEPVERYWLGGRERRPATRQPDAAPRPAPGDAVVEEIRKLAAAVQWSGREGGGPHEGSWISWVPWAVALALAAFLFMDRRAEAPARTASLIVDFDPTTLKAVTVPLVRAENAGDEHWVLRSEVDLPGVNGAACAQLPGLDALRAALQARADALARAEQEQAEAQSLLRRWGLVGGAVLAALLAAAGAAWYFFLRRS